MEPVFENEFYYLSFFMLSNRNQNSQELRRVASDWESLCGCNLQCVNMSIVWVSSEKHSANSFLVILTWSGVRSCSKILRKRLKRRHINILPSAQETERESSLGQRVKNHGNGWLTSTKTQVWTEEKTLWGRVLVVTAVKSTIWLTDQVS